MAIPNQHRCPACGNVVDASTLGYSATMRDFVCPACLQVGAKPEVETARDVDFHPPPAMPSRETSPASRQRKALPRWLVPAAGLAVAALILTGIAIVLLARGRSADAVDARRAWEAANRQKIIALKSRAEELTIQNRLKEAHATYRELEALVGGQAISDASLFDLVDQARLDQGRVYRMILNAMSPQTVDAGPLPSAVEAQTTQATTTSFAAPRPLDRQSPTASPPAPAASAPSVARADDSAPVTAPAPPPASPRPAPRSYNAVTDAQVEQAIRRGVDFLIAQFEDGYLRRGSGSDLEHKGLNALAVYALLQSSQAIRDERLSIRGEFFERSLERLKTTELLPPGDVDPPLTYARSLRASALATYNRPQDRAVLEEDVKWLVSAAAEGTYTYDDRFARSQPRAGGAADDQERAPGGTRISRLDLAALRPPMMILAHNGEVMMPPTPPVRPVPRDVITRPRTPSYPRPPGYVAPPRPYVHTPIYQLPQPGYRNKLKPPIGHVPWDNSTSQYGVLGVWAGAEVGVEVPEQYWKDVQEHWRRSQLPSGQWSYAPNFEGSYSMTVGGIATLLVAHDMLEAPMLGTRTAGRKPYDDFITAGLAFLEHGDNVLDITQSPEGALYYAGYNLFGLERVGLASGLKYIGQADWYVELSAKMLQLQHANGAWGKEDRGHNAVIDTSYMLLFLARGRHPVMMNKLRFDGFWTNRPRDLANLAAHASREMERPLNWQVVDIHHPADEWADSPILYIASNEAPRLGAEEIDNIRAFVEAGGLLFTHADQGSDRFTAWAAKLAKEVFPGQALENVSPQHPLYSLNYKIENPRPRLQAVDNGVRLLMVHSPTDLASAWQTRSTESRKTMYQLGINLYLYATGKERFRNRLDTRAVPEPPAEPAPQIDIAQVKYDGNWNPEPGAWPRFVKSFQNNTGTRLVVHAATAAELDVNNHVIAVLTGAGPGFPDEAALAPVAKFVRDGGTLLVDACGGSGAFANAIEPWLAKLDPNAALQPVTPQDPLLKDLGPEQIRLYALEQLGGAGAVRLRTMPIGNGRIVFTPLDYTSGLLGTNTWGILGYLPEYSESLATNVILATSRQAKN